jgi:PTS system nitrogen regulatory IIA component
MKISDFLCPDAVTADLKAKNKEEVIDELVTLLVASGAIEKKHKSKIIEVIMAREALGSTAIGQGIAIPHGKSDCVSKLVSGLGVSKKGIDFDSLDGEPAHIFFILIAPQDSAGPHLKALARVSRLLKDKYFRESLKSAKDSRDIAELVSQEDSRSAA